MTCRFPLQLWLCAQLILPVQAIVQAQTGSVVTINADNVLVLNGRKVFPIGFSPGPPTGGVTSTGDDAMQEFHNAGALLVRMPQSSNWSSNVIAQQQAALDWAALHDMYCWVNLRELSEFPVTDTNTPLALRALVDTFRNHPALGLWKNYDEAWWSGVSAASLSNGYAVIEQEDTNHPVVQTHAPRGTVSDLQRYNVAADVLAVDIYPVAIPPPSNPPLTNTNISVVGDWTSVIGQVAAGQKEFWTIEQIAFSGTTPPSHTLVFPTFAQSRYMAYQALIDGARGLMFYGGNIAATLNAQDAPLGWNWTFWNTVLKPVVQQLGDHSVLAPALVAPNSTLPIALSGARSPDIEFCVREAPPYLYLLASKREGSSVNATFSGLPNWAHTGEVLFESPRTVTVSGGQFTDTFAPFDVHVYRFTGTNQSPSIIWQSASVTNHSGAQAAFLVTADGTGPLTYHWRKDGVELSDGGRISGALTPTLTISSIAGIDSGGYDVVVTGLGSVTSAPPQFLSVITNAPSGPLLLYEPFNYTNIGGPVSSNAPDNWTYGGSAPNDLSVVNGNLAYPGLAASIGYSVTNGGAGFGVRRWFGTSVNSGKLFFSALFRINNLGYGTWNGGSSYVGALCATDNTSFKLGVMVKSNSPSGYVFGVQKSGAGALTTFGTAEYHAGETVLLVGRYDFTESPNTVALWIDPNPETLGLPTEPATGYLSATTGTDGFALDRFNLRQNTPASVPAAMQWDELRVGTSWAAVTPTAAPPRLIGAMRLPGVGFEFGYTNTSGLAYSVYASTNLLNWAPLGAATQSTPGIYWFFDSAATNCARRFYRLQSP